MQGRRCPKDLWEIDLGDQVCADVLSVCTFASAIDLQSILVEAVNFYLFGFKEP